MVMQEFVDDTYTSGIDRTKQVLVDRLLCMIDGLEWLIENGVDVDRPEDISTDINLGVCVVIGMYREDVAISLEYILPVAVILEQASYAVTGTVMFPINVIPTFTALQQYLLFVRSINHHALDKISRTQFNAYARARITLIQDVLREISNVEIGYCSKRASYVRL